MLAIHNVIYVWLEKLNLNEFCFDNGFFRATLEYPDENFNLINKLHDHLETKVLYSALKEIGEVKKVNK